MKVSEMLKLLKKSGCYIVSHGRNHDVWYSPKTKKKFTVPRHQTHELPTGTANSIKKEAGLE